MHNFDVGTVSQIHETYLMDQQLFCWRHFSKIEVVQNTDLNIFTLFESGNERQKIEPVPIPLPRASRNFPDVKTRNEKKIYNWTLEIIPFIRFGKQMDRT